MCAVVKSVLSLNSDISVVSPVRLAVASVFRPAFEG